MKTDIKISERHLKALANRRRLLILSTLKNKKEDTVGSIAANIRLSFKATSNMSRVFSRNDRKT